jgi:hypothetical protein
MRGPKAFQTREIIDIYQNPAPRIFPDITSAQMLGALFSISLRADYLKH